MDASVIGVLLGALIGATAGVAGQVLAARYASRNERRRLAVEAGLREWERAMEHGGRVFPSAFFVYFNDQLIRLLDADALTPNTYRDLMQRSAQMRDAIVEQTTERRRTHEP